MFRFLTLSVLALVLAACGQAGASPSTDGSEPVSPGMSAPESAAPSGDAAGTASAECTEAFAPIEEMELTSLTELGDLPDEVGATIEACGSIDEWIAAAEGAVDDEINPNTVRLLLGMSCGDTSLSRTEICRELASS
jgi:hypothetical protein